MTEMSFAASGLDRAAHLRRDTDALAAALADGAPVLPLWRGKPLLDAGGGLVWLPAQHPVLAEAGPPVLLGRDGEVLRFAADVSAWEPEEQAAEGFFDPTVQVHPEAPEDTGFRELRGAMSQMDARSAELAAIARALLLWHVSHRFCAACGRESGMQEAGWHRQCEACGTRHFPRTDPVVIMLVTYGDDVLLGRSPGWPEGMYSLLAGFVEPGETIEAAAAREVFEESGIVLGPVRYLACQPWPFPASLMIGVGAEALTREITLDPAELEDAIWVPREELVEALGGRHARLKPARRGAIARGLIVDWLAGRAG
ncbi:NAD(+) diphosphatase [Rhodobacterales bacterium HKCCE3408]|nr:NAD(+) diphosphatase [Rhodobacterales bacterium HKCCE3408]